MHIRALVFLSWIVISLSLFVADILGNVFQKSQRLLYGKWCVSFHLPVHSHKTQSKERHQDTRQGLFRALVKKHDNPYITLFLFFPSGNGNESSDMVISWHGPAFITFSYYAWIKFKKKKNHDQGIAPCMLDFHQLGLQGIYKQIPFLWVRILFIWHLGRLPINFDIDSQFLHL